VLLRFGGVTGGSPWRNVIAYDRLFGGRMICEKRYGKFGSEQEFVERLN